jgi:hypothetical protein
MQDENYILDQCIKSLEIHGFTLEGVANSRYDIVDQDYQSSKACCVHYPYPDYGKQDLTIEGVTTHTFHVVQNMQALRTKQKSNHVK